MSLEYFECAKTQMLKIHVLVVAEPPSPGAAADASAQAPSPDADAADAASAQPPSPADAAGAADAASAEPPADDASDAQIQGHHNRDTPPLQIVFRNTKCFLCIKTTTRLNCFQNCTKTNDVCVVFCRLRKNKQNTPIECFNSAIEFLNVVLPLKNIVAKIYSPSC